MSKRSGPQELRDRYTAVSALAAGLMEAIRGEEPNEACKWAQKWFDVHELIKGETSSERLFALHRRLVAIEEQAFSALCKDVH